MAPASRNNIRLGALCVGLALVLALGLIPADTETGLVEKVRRRLVIGDALAPTIAAGFILLGGAMLMLFEHRAGEQPGIGAATWRFLGAIMAVVVVSMLLMRHAGPLAVEWAGAGEYRLLRDTVPWKHIGYLAGGTTMVAGLVMVIEGRASLRAVLVGIGMVLVLIALFDLPFDDLLLPPNGDV